MLEHIIVRPLQQEDMVALRQLYQICFPKEYQWIDSTRFMEKTFADPDLSVEASVCIEEQKTGTIMAAILGKESQPYEKEIYQNVAWISLLMVHPDATKRGFATKLYEVAEQIWKKKGIQKIIVGMEFRNFFSGIPAPNLANIEFFKKMGYWIAPTDHFDMTSDIQDNKNPDALGTDAFGAYYVRPLREDMQDQKDLIQFLEREFPDRWLFEMIQYLHSQQKKERIYLLLRKSDSTVQGFCLTHFYQDLDKNGGLGPIGIAQKIRGERLGEFLLTQSLIGLRQTGAREICIDWTQLDQFYGKYGFYKKRFYRAAEKTI